MSLSIAASTQQLDPAAVFAVLERVRDRKPRVHVVTNTVAQAFSANVLLAVGAVPSMTLASDEIAGFVSTADALLVNLGTLDPDRREAIALAIQSAKDKGAPVVLDPVFVDRSPVRCAYACTLLASAPALVRANAGEMAALFPDRTEVDGMIAAGTVFAVSGEDDRIEGAGEDYLLRNGHTLMARVTGTGCAGGAVLAAFASVEPDVALAAACGLSVFNIAGEIAATRSGGPGSLVPELLDALYNLTLNDIESRLRTG